jgi:hypothetical protein
MTLCTSGAPTAVAQASSLGHLTALGTKRANSDSEWLEDSQSSLVLR